MHEFETMAVEFYSDGTKIAGDLFVPSDTVGPLPCVIVAHGFGGIKSFFVGDIAATFAQAGFVALTFDYRGFGESGGTRNRLRPLEQVEDVRAAAVYLRTRPEVDSTRIVAYGTSFGGGIAIAAVAEEPELRAVVCAVGIADCGRWLKSLRRHWEWLEFLQRLDDDRTRRTLSGRSEVVEPEEIMVRDPESEKHERYLRENWPARAFKLDLASGEAIMRFKAVDYAARLDGRPLMLVGVTEDGLTGFEHTAELADAATGPVTLVTLTGVAHHDIYQPQHRDGLMEQVVTFLKDAVQ